MGKSTAMKRSVNDGKKSTSGSSSSGRKRRRMAHDNERQNVNNEPIPMEIDEILETTEEVVQGTVTVATAPFKGMKGHVNVADYITTSRHAPVPPPTPRQVAQHILYSEKKKAAKTTTTKYPKAPPPSPFTPQGMKKAATMKSGPKTNLKLPAVVSETNSPATTPTNVTTADPVSKTLFQKMIVPALILVIPFLLVSTAIPESTISFNVNLDWPHRGLKQVRSVFKDSSIAIPSWGSKPKTRLFAHIVPPNHVTDDVPHESFLTNTTLREFLAHSDGIHLAMAPAFFGFYAYFGALAAWNDHLVTNTTFLESNIASVAGGSAGAMAAVLIAAGICPRRAAEYVGSMTLRKFADPPGIGGLFKGQLFEMLMKEFMQSETNNASFSMQDSGTPVAVTAFDIKTFSGKILDKGCMARAARASATFPLLFQPVKWEDDETNDTAFLIDGGVFDGLGLVGLSVLSPDKPKRVVNMMVGGTFPGDGPKGPSAMPEGVLATEVVSISIQNTPLCGPWAMANGPRAVEASCRAMEASLDLPLYKGNELGHYELHIDASSFVPN